MRAPGGRRVQGDGLCANWVHVCVEGLAMTLGGPFSAVLVLLGTRQLTHFSFQFTVVFLQDNGNMEQRLPPNHLSNDLRQRVVRLCVLEEQLTSHEAADRLCIDHRTAEAVLEAWFLTGKYEVQPLPPHVRNDRNMQPEDEVWFLKMLVRHPSLFGFQYVVVFNQFRRNRPGDIPITIWHVCDVFKVRACLFSALNLCARVCFGMAGNICHGL